MQSKFKTNKGELTPYSYACGYITRIEKNNAYKQIFAEHRTYHVQSGLIGEKYKFWETFETLTQAKKFFKSIKL